MDFENGKMKKNIIYKNWGAGMCAFVLKDVSVNNILQVHLILKHTKRLFI